MERFASSFGPKLIASIGSEIKSGAYRSDLDPAMTMISLMGMTIFPFLARPMLEGILQQTIDQDFVDRVTLHNETLFHKGVLAGATEGASS